jgi:hypothetical protein
VSRKTDLAWAAGFFDGEGCFHCSGPHRKRGGLRKTLTIRAAITQVHPEVILKFQRIVELGNVYGPYIRPAGQPSYRWALASGSKVEVLLELLWPYLGSVKRIQGRDAVDRWRAYGNHKSEIIASKKLDLVR